MVLGSTEMGGAQMFILNLLNNIDLNHFQFDLAVNFEEQKNGLGDEFKQKGCNIYYLPYFKVYNYLSYVNKWRKFLSTHHYDIVHAHSTNSAAIYLKIAKEMGCRTIAHSHSAGFRGNLPSRLMKAYFSKRLGNVADYWYACSAKAAANLYGKDFASFENFHFIPNAINVEKYLFDPCIADETRKKLGIHKDVFLCGHVGSFSAPKNHIFLIEIFMEILKMRPNSKLICCGAGPLLPEIQEKVSLLGIDDKVIFTGVVKKCENYLMAMDVFIFPSLFEGFPISIVEAEATGLPIMMSDVITKEVDITDCIHRKELCEPAYEWAKSICDLTCNGCRSLYNSKVVNSQYNMHRSVNKLQNLYEQLYSEQS